MLIVSRKNGQKIIINDNIEVIVVESKNGLCKIAINAPKDVKIYREEIYYQIKLANLVGKDTNVQTVASVSDLLKDDKVKLNKDITTSAEEANDVEVEKSKKIVIKKKTTD